MFLDGERCGGHVRKASGKISRGVSSAVTLTTPRNDTCHWLIQVTQGKQVMLVFSNVTLIGDDFIDVYDGKETFTPFVRFTSSNPPLPITSNDHYVRIIAKGNFEISFSESRKDETLKSLLYRFFFGGGFLRIFNGVDFT